MNSTLVNIPNHGLVQGVSDDQKSVRKFLNIPFATVHKRWRTASPAKPWSGIRDATQYGPMCPQTIDSRPLPGRMLSDMFGLPTCPGPEMEYSERDCLNMALYVPNAPVPSGGFPTIVYIHGGRYQKGGNSHPAQDFSNFVQASMSTGKPVIVAAINYRLNHLGFLGSRELALEFDLDPENSVTHDQDEAYGNWGLHDQKLGFEWIRDHIHVFGGKGSELTAMGHSAGSTSLLYHMMIPSHHGLFTRAIAHSSPTATMASYASALYGQKVVNSLCGHFQVSDEITERCHGLPEQQQKDLSVVQFLRSIPAEALVNAPDVPGNLNCSRLTLDNTSLFPCHSFQMIRDPSRMDPGVTAVFLGTTLDEASGFVSQMGAGTVAGFQQALDRLIDPKLHSRLLALYGTPTTDEEAKHISAEYMRDLEFWSPASAVLQSLRQQPTRAVHRFYLETGLKCVDKFGLGLGAFHCIDVNHSIMSDVALRYLNEQEQRLGWAMVGKWIDVAWGEDSFLSKDLSGMKHDQVALQITKDFRVTTCPLERMDREKLDLMDRNTEWVVRRNQASLRSSAQTQRQPHEHVFKARL
ncbi:MAG: Alpha/Beta hydrolase protein [Podila humilis]|nr:MAG: Alpha/Beta hydrolase protein [Podila humilis]